MAQTLELPQVYTPPASPAFAAVRTPAVRIPTTSPNLRGFAAESVGLLESILPELAALVMSYLSRPSNVAQRASNAGLYRRQAPTVAIPPIVTQNPVSIPSAPAEPLTPPLAPLAPAPAPSAGAVDIIAAGLAAARGCSSKVDCGTHFLDACIAIARANGVSPAPCLDFAQTSYGMGSPRLRAQFELDYDNSTAGVAGCPNGFVIDPTTGSCVLSTST